ncbi:hypothetical protein ACWENQ_39790 [Nonomuraea sp. NPDC004354]
MTQRHPYPHADLQEVISRNHTATHLLDALTRSAPANASIWEHLATALADTRTLIAELTQLRTELSSIRHSRANLLAAAQATLAAHYDGEPDSLYYLRDEIAAQRTSPRGEGGDAQ